ncbi:MAG TPA: cytochrome b/b6 domain-containing protein [Hyphomicrobium sp.]|nr:cytochrome b/b6 domain-containing protein [Hyphomicrobium sp.]
MTETPRTQASVPAWDLPIRVFHWTLLALIVGAWVSVSFAEALGDTTLVYHRINGLAILTLIVWRILWGFAGSSTARFTGFVRGPLTLASYAGALLRGRARRYLGHNPMGGLMVLALLATVATIGSLGLFAVDDNDLVGGPLYRLVGESQNIRLTRLHDQIFYTALLPLVMLHIAVNSLYTLVKKDPLIQAMVTGRKPAMDYADAPRAAPVSLGRAVVLLATAAAIVLGGILALGGSLRL